MKYFFTLLTLLLIISCSQEKKTESKVEETVQPKKPKNIILLIGDGTGLSQVSASQYFNPDPSNFDRFPVIGLIKTSSSDQLITDSAAGATAFASGVKSYNGAIGVNKDSIPVPTIVEEISKNGLSTGVIATSSINHATPASFYAHAKLRGMYEEIAAFLPTSDIDFLAGGGIQFFNKRKDGKDLLSEFEKNGFKVDTTALPEKTDTKKHAILLAENAMPTMLEGRGDFLPKATQLAIDALSKNEEGFFLMVEGSQIDWGGHDNNADYLISELIDFDKTLGVALDFAKSNGETLVIVTADHETGGFTLAPDDGDYNKIAPSFSTGGHSATLIPVFAYGPESENFGGIYENNEIYHKMKAALGKN
ncbi:alkaline phosphatase [Aquimarina sp. 2201CG5-10]|uniref:alkaline phosphatase n=1 Tax=Aquimarina callyspongiae TaxID=3098150 RepID=UPI002AB32C5B|nr:alkaline phosphatase [Aquimarina sp. 2201CG5-10]MDY8135505.1 alkaline phosphatase [Aquimarina sp. 2201CG5-10]